MIGSVVELTPPAHKADELKILTAGDLIDLQLEPREDLIAPWLRQGESLLLWSASGLGKTWLTLSMAIAMAGGGKVGNWKCPKPRRVLLIDGEMHLQDLKERIETLTLGDVVQEGDADAAASNLSIIARQHQDPNVDFFDITEPASQKKLRQQCKNLDVDILIIDNLSTVADGLQDENAATAFKPVQKFLLSMKQMGIATILVHHSRKDGKEARGSSAIATTFEVIIGLEKPKTPVIGKASFLLSFGKFRAKGDETLAPTSWTLEDHCWKIEDDSDSTSGRVLCALQSHDYINQSELAKGLGMAQSTVSKTFARLKGEERLTQDDIDQFFSKAKAIRDADGEIDQAEAVAVSETDPEDDF